MRLTLLLFVLFLPHIPTAQADIIDYHFDLICKSAENRAEIVPYGAWNTLVYSDAPQDCTLANGRTIRVKMGLGPVSAYRRGGADPSQWVSVWVDKAQVLSGLHFDCDGGGPCRLKIVVTARGMELCRRTSEKFQEHCEFTPNEKLPKERDELEFPLSAEKAPPSPGSLATLYAKDEKFCDQFRRLSKPRGRPGDGISPQIWPPQDTELFEPVGPSTYADASRYPHYLFDVNNDGSKETLVVAQSRTYRIGDVYFVYPPGKAPTPVVPGSARTAAQYAKEAIWILLDHWSDYTRNRLTFWSGHRIRARSTGTQCFGPNLIST